MTLFTIGGGVLVATLAIWIIATLHVAWHGYLFIATCLSGKLV